MAGNTKLLGFSAVKEGALTLERWGGKAEVVVSPESLAALRKTCFEDLPRAPATQSHWPDYKTAYEGDMGRTALSLNMVTTKILVEALGRYIDHRQGVDSEGKTGLMENLREDLKRCVEEHKAYLDTDNEPGVDDERG